MTTIRKSIKKTLDDRYDSINSKLNGAIGRMMVLATSNHEIKEAHQMVIEAANEFDELFNELSA